MAHASHIPVLLEAVKEHLCPQTGETVADVTLGLGGHARMFVQQIGQSGTLIGLDADSENLAQARQELAVTDCTLDLRHANFRSLPALQLPTVDILFADLGVSSPHFDDPERGFTFRHDAPLDLRYDRTTGQTAAELLAQWSEQDAFLVLKKYGELERARKLARVLCDTRCKTTFELKECVEQVYDYRAKHVLPQVFQALRIAVNQELTALEILLEHGPSLLKPGGRMGVIAYHSLEDRLVKNAFRDLSTPARDPVTGTDLSAAEFSVLQRKPIVPSDEECERNPRSRSAKLRILLRSPA